jgi:hypothetical protein
MNEEKTSNQTTQAESLSKNIINQPSKLLTEFIAFVQKFGVVGLAIGVVGGSSRDQYCD